MLVYYIDECEEDPVFVELSGKERTRHDVGTAEFGEYINDGHGRLIHRSRLVAEASDPMMPACLIIAFFCFMGYLIGVNVQPSNTNFTLYGLITGLFISVCYAWRDYRRAKHFNNTP